MRLLGLTCMLFVNVLFLAGCFGAEEGEDETTTPAPTTTTTPPATSGGKLTVTGQDTPPGTTPGRPFGWTPSTFTANVNSSLEIVLTAPMTNRLTHNLVIVELQVSITGVMAGQSKNATVVLSKTGTFNYYCDVGGTGPSGHRALGMDGRLTVS